MKAEIINGDYVLTFSQEDFDKKDITKLKELAARGTIYTPEEVLAAMNSIEAQNPLENMSLHGLQHELQHGYITMLEMLDEIEKRSEKNIKNMIVIKERGKRR